MGRIAEMRVQFSLSPQRYNWLRFVSFMIQLEYKNDTIIKYEVFKVSR